VDSTNAAPPHEPHQTRRAKVLRGLVRVVLAVALFFVAREGAGFLLDRLWSLETVAMTEDGEAAIAPRYFAARPAALLPVDRPAFRLSENEPWEPISERWQRLMIPADKVHGTEPLMVQLRYRNILGQVRTPWRKVDVKEALSNARESAPRECHIVFEEKSDHVGTVVYSVPGGAENVSLPIGVSDVALAKGNACPASIVVEIHTLDGHVAAQRVTPGDPLQSSQVLRTQ
jgi:hypothetical protein